MPIRRATIAAAVLLACLGTPRCASVPAAARPTGDTGCTAIRSMSWSAIAGAGWSRIPPPRTRVHEDGVHQKVDTFTRARGGGSESGSRKAGGSTTGDDVTAGAGGPAETGRTEDTTVALFSITSSESLAGARATPTTSW